jgi:hypothetical protein
MKLWDERGSTTYQKIDQICKIKQISSLWVAYGFSTHKVYCVHCLVCPLPYTVWWCLYSELIECMDKEKGLQWHTMSADTIHPPPSRVVPRSLCNHIIKHCNSSPIYCYYLLLPLPPISLFSLSLSLPPSLYLSPSPSLRLSISLPLPLSRSVALSR